MIVFRLAKSKYCHDLSGKGAEITGGRWNSKGVAMVYTSESRALCVAEIAVHIQLTIIPTDFTLIHIFIPDSLNILEMTPEKLPTDWNSIPPINMTQAMGDSFIRVNTHPIFKLPSAVIPGDFNYLINPTHTASRKIEIIKTEPFTFDKRLFR